ncbi:hypothetical protein [Streptomyces sp. XD-27]|uniref:hypothetical protein n=1 Tax=Streptomyces sp. XD-27 TaxID=3062779 RepID=UPI0026F4754B|nr:hypothetical protein [Streptomyces sp. XD-27]WKX73066.1 hypothetical protein Q3Y56_27020 [Streptomyces sp. XD-27]
MVATLTLASGCGSKDGGGSSSGDSKSGTAVGQAMAKLPVQPTTPAPEPTETEEPDDPINGLISPDVTMGNCGWDASSKPYADVKIANSSSTTQYYTLLVGFYDANSSVVATGAASYAEVAGDAKKTVRVTGTKADSSKKAKRCQVTFASKKGTKPGS